MEKMFVVFAFGSFFLAPMAIGVFALREINRSREPMNGRWLAIAGIVLGMIGIAVSVPMTLLGASDQWTKSSRPPMYISGTKSDVTVNGIPVSMSSIDGESSSDLQNLVRQHGNYLGYAEGHLQSDPGSAEQYLNQAMAVRLANEKIPADLQAALKAQEERVSAKIAKKRDGPAPAATVSMAEKQLQDVLAAARDALDRSDLDAAQKYVDVGKSLDLKSVPAARVAEMNRLTDQILEKRKKLELERITKEAQAHERRMLDDARKKDLEARAKAENVERTQSGVSSPVSPVATPTPPKVAPKNPKASSVGEQDPFE